MQHHKQPAPGAQADAALAHGVSAHTAPLASQSRSAIARDIKSLEQELEARRHSGRPLRRSVLMAYAAALSQREERLEELARHSKESPI